MNNYLTEAFKKLDVLNEDVFEVDDEGIAQLKDFEIEDKYNDTVSIIDPNAEDEEGLSDNYVGKVILDCCVCHSKIYEDKEDVELDEDGELANVDKECPFCYSTDGFKVIGQVTEYDPKEEDEEEVEVKAKEDDKDTDVDVEVKEKEKVEEGVSRKRRDIIDAEADNKKERLKKFIARKRDDIDSDRDYRMKRGITRRNEGKCRGKDCELKEAPIYGLNPQFDSRKSFYGKAQVDTGDDGLSNRLYSYDTLVAEIKNGKPVVYGTFSQTTLRHIKDWLKQLGFKADSAKQIMADYGEKVNESLDSISIDTGDQTIDISAHDKEKTFEAGADEETIEPVSAEVKSEIIANSEPEGEEIEADIDEFSEEDFDGLGESYLKKAYNNVESYKTTKASVNGNFLRLEGVITFKSGNKKKTNFVFESKAMTKDGRVKFIGENAQICKGRKAFTIIGTLKENKFLPESLKYNYKANDKETGLSKRVYGTVRTKK